MKWTFSLNRKRVTWEIADSLVAIPPRRKFKTPAREELEKLDEDVGDVVDTYRRHIPDREIFERAGWRFINPDQAGHAADVRQVYFSESGDLMIETKLAIVQLAEARHRKQITPERSLAEDGLRIVHRLSFAPNLYAVRVLSQRPLPETIDVLQRKNHRYVFAEPSVLQRITGRLIPDDPLFEQQWQHASGLAPDGSGGFGLHSSDAWNITRGRGECPVRVAIIDNGMDIDHTDLQGAIAGGGYFKPDAPGSGSATFVRIEPGMTDFPIRGHGTFCMGMVGARQNNEDGGCGIAPESELIAVACAVDQTGTQMTLARAIEFAVNPSQVDPDGELVTGADIISCSLRTANVLESVLELAINSAADGRNGLGVPIFWAAPNESTEISNDLVCSLDGVIAVGRSNPEGLPDGSAFGPKLEYLAPGRRVFGPSFGDHYVISSGTSFAAPLAAGVAALVLSLHPDWPADDVRQKLRDSCDNPNGSGHDDEFGFGRLNAFAAVQ